MLRRVMLKKARNLLSLSMAVWIGTSLGWSNTLRADEAAALGKDIPWQDAHMLAEVLDRVEHDYVNAVDDHQLLQAAIRGMVSSLDPYSAYLDSDEYDEIKISSSGQYSGVGIEVSMEDEQVVVVSPFDGSPAAVAGIRSGDVIASIDGVPVNTTTLADTIGRMRGKEGTAIKIGVLRRAAPSPWSSRSSGHESNCTACGRSCRSPGSVICESRSSAKPRARTPSLRCASCKAQWRVPEGLGARSAQQSGRSAGGRGGRCRRIS